MGDKSHKNINHSSVKALDMESCRIQLQCILYLPMHKCWITHESKGELFMHNEDPLPDKTELLLFRILKIIFSGTSSGFILLGFGFLFCFTFFYLNIPFFVLCTPGRSRRGTVMVWQKYWPKQEVPETSRETFLRSEVQVCHFKTCVCPE